MEKYCTVLVIDNRESYVNEIIKALSECCCVIPYHVSTSESKKEIAKVKNILEENLIDVVICNMHMFDKKIEDHLEYAGIEVLKYVNESHKGIAAIIGSAHNLRRIAPIRERYNLVDIIGKYSPGGNVEPSFVNDVVEVVSEVIKNSHPVKRNIKGQSYELQGIDAQIYRFLNNRKIISKIFEGIKDFDDRLLRSLGSMREEESQRESIELIKDLWNQEKGLPAYPIFKQPAQAQLEAFYEVYFDHLVPMLRVYLLGIYLYYGCEPLRVEVLNEFENDEEFLLAWKIAALFHDLGYVFLTKKGKQSNVAKDALAQLNELKKYALYKFFKYKK